MYSLGKKASTLSILCVLLFSTVAAPAQPVDASDTPPSDVEVQDVYDVNDGVADTSEHDDKATDKVERVTPPDDVEGLTETVRKAITSFENGSWLLFAIAVIQVLMFTIKRLRPTKWIAKAHGTAVVLSLSAVASVLSLVVGGASPIGAIIIFLGSSGTKVLHDIAHKLGILDHKKHETNEG